MKKITALAFCFLLFASGGARAAIMNLDAIQTFDLYGLGADTVTRDDVNDRDWLDLTLTTSLSVADFDLGGDYTGGNLNDLAALGWTLANATDVQQLFASGGVMVDYLGNGDTPAVEETDNFANIENTLQLFGVTRRNGQNGLFQVYNEPNTGPWAEGIALDDGEVYFPSLPDPTTDPEAYYAALRICFPYTQNEDNDAQGIPSNTEASLYCSQTDNDLAFRGGYRDDEVGLWLYQDVVVDDDDDDDDDDDGTVSVPEPSILALFAAGLFGIGLARRRMRS